MVALQSGQRVESRLSSMSIAEQVVAHDRHWSCSCVPGIINDNRQMPNLLENIPRDLLYERFETLVENETVRIERIVSKGHASPATGWYDQDRSEWVLLLRGAARLAFEDGREVEMTTGDWLEIPAHQKHRVAWTDPDQPAIWLAMHYR
jgi:cupin 2 domain-containing protein